MANEKMKKLDFFLKGEKILVARNFNVSDNITEEEIDTLGVDDAYIRDVIRAGQTLACDLVEDFNNTFKFKAVITNQPPREYEKQEFHPEDIDRMTWGWVNLKDEKNTRYRVSSFIDNWTITGFPRSGDANARGSIAITGRCDILRELTGLAVLQKKIALSLSGNKWTGTLPVGSPAPCELPRDRNRALKLVVVGDLTASISGSGSIESIKCTAFKVSNKKYVFASIVEDDTLTLVVSGDYSGTKTGIEPGDTITDLVPGLLITISDSLSSGEQDVITSIANVGNVPVTSINVAADGNVSISLEEIADAGIITPQFCFLVYAFDPMVTKGVYPVIKPDSFFD